MYTLFNYVLDCQNYSQTDTNAKGEEKYNAKYNKPAQAKQWKLDGMYLYLSPFMVFLLFKLLNS